MDGGRESSGKFRFMRTWVRDGEEWRLLAQQMTLVAAK
jgi:hypothetical protein